MADTTAAAEKATAAAANAKSKMNDLKENGLALPGEAADKCCWCLPIKIGCILIGVVMLLYTLNMVQVIIWWLDFYLLYAILFLVAALPMFGGAYFYIRWFMDIENKERK